MAARAGIAPDTVAGWTELSDSPEMAAYFAAIAIGKPTCDEFQVELDGTSEREIFDDPPWLPTQLSESVNAVAGCAWFPENLEDLYRSPPAS